MQLSGINSKPRGGKILRDIIDRAIGVCLYPPPGSAHYKLLHLGIPISPLTIKHHLIINTENVWEESLVMCIMWFISIAQSNCDLRSFQWPRTPDSNTWKNTARSLKLFNTAMYNPIHVYRQRLYLILHVSYGTCY